MSLKDQGFFEGLGSRIAVLRREAGMTQAQLAEVLKCSQQHVVSFEKGRYRVPANLLPVLAELFGVSSDYLLDTETKAAKRGPPSRLEQQLQELSRLPKNKQRFVSEMLDTVLKQAS